MRPGQSIHTEYTARIDGKDYPITGSPIVDTVSIERIDSRTREYTGKKAGQVVGTGGEAHHLDHRQQ